MNMTLLTEAEWAEVEFRGGDFWDKRNSKRLIKMATGLARTPSGTLPAAFPKWADLKAAYRLFTNSRITYEESIKPHLKQTRQRCQSPGEYLIIEDTTLLDFSSHKQTKGLGRIGDDRGLGLLLHTSLAGRIRHWNDREVPEINLLGLFGQMCWAREAKETLEETKTIGFSGRKESQRWGEVFEQTGGPPPDSRWIYLADRESDIWNVFIKCLDRRIDFVIRAAQPRVLAVEGGSLFNSLSKAKLLGRFNLDLRARPGQPARIASAEVYSRSIKLLAPGEVRTKYQPLRVNVVEVREVNAPDGIEPIHWVLLTTLPVETFKSAMKVIGIYTRRWLIEEYHKVLKSGTQIEKSQMKEGERIKRLLGILSVVAVRILNTKLLAVVEPDSIIKTEEVGLELVKILEGQFGIPEGGWTNKSLLIAIARLGGFLARRGDGNPGWITIWRGWQRLIDMINGYQIAVNLGEKRYG
jgi:hypothetical protein